MENGIQGIILFVWYFLFFVFTQLIQMERSILYKLYNSLVIFGESKFFDLFELEEGLLVKFKLFLDDVNFLSFSRFLFLPNIGFLIAGSFELK